ncbi:hypothetical protein Clocl_0348 [Acetivibrio clariflavus DSM 19732]|uniref:Uncharacterized protein n=1 Tax=Acetivibrio clariflavus (strain DSM 19732 / NBRC 101661 / EBR45) TaxID=720554 RepID=G8M2L1_ACECE|nr:hypothetical protein Clocl_0348 [Acetivibrio clariflavus DSM 19732]
MTKKLIKQSKRQTGPHMNDTIINKNGWKSFVNR